MIEELLTINEVSKILKVSRRTINHWVKQGRLPHVRLSNRILRFKASEIMNLISMAMSIETKIKENPKVEKKVENLANEIIEKIFKH